MELNISQFANGFPYSSLETEIYLGKDFTLALRSLCLPVV